jgi:hypothetical protein
VARLELRRLSQCCPDHQQVEANLIARPEDTVKRSIQDAFGVAREPPTGDISANDCSFCIRLTESFAARRWEDLDPATVDQHAGDIHLLSPQAFIYYLPAFLCRAIDHPIEDGIGSSEVLDFTVHSLCDEELPTDTWWADRAPHLSPSQKAAVKAFLEWVVQLPDEYEDGELRMSAEGGLSKYWSTA